jgi:hypothetical protein
MPRFPSRPNFQRKKPLRFPLCARRHPPSTRGIKVQTLTSLRNQVRLYLQHYHVSSFLHRQISRAYRTSSSKSKAHQRRILQDLIGQVVNSCELRARPPCTPVPYDHVTQSLFGDDDDFSVSVEASDVSFSGDVEFSDDSVSSEVVVEVSDDDSVEFLFSVPPQIHDNIPTTLWHSDPDYIDITDELSVCSLESSCDV